MDDFFASEEGKKSIQEFVDKLKREKAIEEQQFERFHLATKYNEDPFIEKVLKKYNSKAYKDRWYNRNIEPPETLLFFMYYYARKYCKECTLDKYVNHFTVEMYHIGSYVIQLMHGQGAAIRIDKLTKKELKKLSI